MNYPRVLSSESPSIILKYHCAHHFNPKDHFRIEGPRSKGVSRWPFSQFWAEHLKKILRFQAFRIYLTLFFYDNKGNNNRSKKFGSIFKFQTCCMGWRVFDLTYIPVLFTSITSFRRIKLFFISFALLLLSKVKNIEKQIIRKNIFK